MKSSLSAAACTAGEQAQFVLLLPGILRSIRFGTRGLSPHEREEACQELTVQAFLGFLQLCRRNLTERGFASTLVRYALKRYRSGRRTGQSSRSIESLPSRRQRNTDVLPKFQRTMARGRPRPEPWMESLQTDPRTPLADQVCFRLDFDAWYESLAPDKRFMIDQLSIGYRPSEVSQNLKVSRARISQMRQELQQNWEQFLGATS